LAHTMSLIHLSHLSHLTLFGDTNPLTQ
jgi:hypothetical protein